MVMLLVKARRRRGSHSGALCIFLYRMLNFHRISFVFGLVIGSDINYM